MNDSDANTTTACAINDVVEEIINSFKALKPPFICPIDNCSKPCLGLMSLKHHLLKVHRERLSQEKQSDDDAHVSDEGQEKNAAAAAATSAKIIFKKRHVATILLMQTLNFKQQNFHCNIEILLFRKKKRGKLRFVNGRKSNSNALNKSQNVTEDEWEEVHANGGQHNSLSPASAAHYNMTYEESLRVAMFHVDNRAYRVS